MTIHLDDNLEQRDDGTVVCRHCDTVLGTANEPLQRALLHTATPGDAGPGVRAESGHFTARAIILRRVLCPQCLTVLHTEIVPADEPSYRTRTIGRPA